MTPIVYVVQEQPGKNILSAQQFGQINVLLPASAQSGFSAGALASQLYVKLAKYRAEDFLLLIGDPVLIGVACAIASHWSNGKVQMLKWDRQEHQYFPVSFDLFQHKKGDSVESDKNTFGR